MGNLEGRLQRKRFDREFEAYLGGFYDDYSYLDEYSNGSKCDLMLEAYYCGCDVSNGKLKQSDIHKVKRYNKDK
jgi:hypothetical protein